MTINNVMMCKIYNNISYKYFNTYYYFGDCMGNRDRRRNETYPPQQGQQYPPPPRGYNYYYPPQPPKSNKRLIIAVIAVVAVVVIAALAVMMLNGNSGSSGGGNTKTLWDVVKEYDTNHDGKISDSEFEHASFTDYKPGDTIHIKDVISSNNPIGGIVAHTFTQEEVDDFYRSFQDITPTINLKAGDTYTFFVLQSVWAHSNGSEYDPCSVLSIVGLPGNLTAKYHPGDSIEFTTTVHSLDVYSNGRMYHIELTEANIMGLAPAIYVGGAVSPLVMVLNYLPTQSNDTKAALQVSMSNPTFAEYTSIHIILSGNGYAEGSYFDPSGTTVIYLGSKQYKVSIVDIDGNNMLNTGDEIIIDGGSNRVGGLTVTISINGYSGQAQTTIPS